MVYIFPQGEAIGVQLNCGGPSGVVLRIDDEAVAEIAIWNSANIYAVSRAGNLRRSGRVVKGWGSKLDKQTVLVSTDPKIGIANAVIHREIAAGAPFILGKRFDCLGP